LACIFELEDLTGSLGDAPPAAQADVVDALSFEDRNEHYRAHAVAEGKKVQDIARRLLEDAGFTKIKEKPKHPGGVIDFSFQATHPGDGSRWWIDVPGAFTTNRPGLQRIDAVWKLLGRLSVLGPTPDAGTAADRVLVLTAGLPKPGSPGDKALRAVGPSVIFDAVELYDPAGINRLNGYATTDGPEPEPGFWTKKDLNP